MPLTLHAPVLQGEDEDIREVSPGSRILWQRLGLAALPERETMLIATERLIVAGTDGLMRSAKRLVKSIQHVGILQNPSVVVQGNVDIHDAEARFEVIAGRRRVLAARLAELAVVKCEVYSSSTTPLSALLALIENEQRSAAWVREVEALRCLIDEGVGMTLDDLAAFGFDRASLSERLKVAQLPAPLLNRILAGGVSRELARKLVRLTQAQQERVAGLTEAGEEITTELVKDLLRVQINAGLVPMQAALAQGWDVPPPPSGRSPLSAPPLTRSYGLPASASEELAEQAACLESEPALEVCSNTSTSSMSMSALLAALHAFEQSPDYLTAPQAVQTLTQALGEQLRVALRDTLSASYLDATVQPQS